MNLLLAIALMFNVVCAYHPNATCYGTGQYENIGGTYYQKYQCSCGDIVLVAD